MPATLPPNPPIKVDDEMSLLLGKAHRVLGRLDGIAEQIPDIDLFVAMYVRKEVLLSSQIEGTQATLDDIGYSNMNLLKMLRWSRLRRKKRPVITLTTIGRSSMWMLRVTPFRSLYPSQGQPHY